MAQYYIRTGTPGLTCPRNKRTSREAGERGRKEGEKECTPVSSEDSHLAPIQTGNLTIVLVYQHHYYTGQRETLQHSYLIPPPHPPLIPRIVRCTRQREREKGGKRKKKKKKKERAFSHVFYNICSSSKSKRTMGTRTRVGSMKHRVTVIGSGNWGSAIAKIVAENTKANPDVFHEEVKMWVFEEQYQLSSSHPRYDKNKHSGSQNLTSIINGIHENPKYLPGIALPTNLFATPSLPDAVSEASILIFNVPHQFVSSICRQINGSCLPYARAVSCIKGVDVSPDGISLFSDTIGRKLGIYCGALSGANIASEVAAEKFSETTIAYAPPEGPTEHFPEGLTPVPEELPAVDHVLLKTLFHRQYFHVRVVSDVAGVSLGGALKNIVALAAGFVDGLEWGDNAKAAVMRVGLLEMRKFGKMFFSQSCKSATFTEESCGVADLITSCNGGRNHKCAMLSVRTGKSIETVEGEELNGQKLQGTITAREVNVYLKNKGLEDEFPLFTAVYRILNGETNVESLPQLIETD